MKKRSTQQNRFKRLWIRKTHRINEVVEAYETYDEGYLERLKKQEPDDEESNIIVSYWTSPPSNNEQGEPMGITHYGWVWDKEVKWEEGDIYTDPSDSWRFIYFAEQ